MKKSALFTIILLSYYNLNAQVSECQVLLPRISGTYEGDCKKGVAHGIGMAQGIDRYEGEFKNGLPEGKGIYRWADGTFFDGYWKKGFREGAGRMIYSADSVITGYWKADKYTGKQNLRDYEVLQSRYIARTSFMKTGKTPLQVKVKLTLGGAPNTDVQDFSMTYSSGDEYRLGAAYALQNVKYPITIRITYMTWNVLRTVMSPAAIEFRINGPGSWDVNIQN